MMKPAIKVIAFLILVGFTAALGGCVPADCKDCRWWSLSDGWKYGWEKGSEKGSGSGEFIRQKLRTEHQAKKTRENTKENIRIAVVQPVPLPKEFSVQVLKAEGVDLPELTPEKIEAVKTSIVKVLAKKGYKVKVTDTASLSLVISLTQYKEGDPGLVRLYGSAYTFGAKKYDPHIIGGTLLLTKGETEGILDMDIPTETTGTNAWTLDDSTGLTLDAVREVFSLIIFYILNDYWDGKLAKTDS
jgi:hypothetical protein